MDSWGYSYLTELKTLWEKEKLLLTSNFSFSLNVFKHCLMLMRQNEYLGLNCQQLVKVCTRWQNFALCQKQNVCQIMKVASESLMSWEQAKKISQVKPFPNNKFWTHPN